MPLKIKFRKSCDFDTLARHLAMTTAPIRRSKRPRRRKSQRPIATATHHAVWPYPLLRRRLGASRILLPDEKAMPVSPSGVIRPFRFRR